MFRSRRYYFIIIKNWESIPSERLLPTTINLTSERQSVTVTTKIQQTTNHHLAWFNLTSPTKNTPAQLWLTASQEKEVFQKTPFPSWKLLSIAPSKNNFIKTPTNASQRNSFPRLTCMLGKSSIFNNIVCNPIPGLNLKKHWTKLKWSGTSLPCSPY